MRVDNWGDPIMATKEDRQSVPERGAHSSSAPLKMPHQTQNSRRDLHKRTENNKHPPLKDGGGGVNPNPKHSK
jgi:hypothetical protein